MKNLSKIPSAEKDLPLGRVFEWVGRHWLVPAVYVCESALTVDFCMRADAETLRTFMLKWRLSPETDDCTAFSPEELLLLEAENPLSLDFTPALCVNGQVLNAAERVSACFNPCLPGGQTELADVMRRYGLNDAFGWVVTRVQFPWSGQRPAAVHSIELSLKRMRAPLPGPRFTVRAPGDILHLTHPFTGTQHTLTAQSLETRTLPETASKRGLPACFTLLRYTLSPEPAEPVQISDAHEGNGSPSAFLVRCADNLHTACSALRFRPADVEWRITFHSSADDALSLSLL